jgi:hypothetical protein
MVQSPIDPGADDDDYDFVDGVDGNFYDDGDDFDDGHSTYSTPNSPAYQRSVLPHAPPSTPRRSTHHVQSSASSTPHRSTHHNHSNFPLGTFENTPKSNSVQSTSNNFDPFQSTGSHLEDPFQSYDSNSYNPQQSAYVSHQLQQHQSKVQQRQPQQWQYRKQQRQLHMIAQSQSNSSSSQQQERQPTSPHQTQSTLHSLQIPTSPILHSLRHQEQQRKKRLHQQHQQQQEQRYKHMKHREPPSLSRQSSISEISSSISSAVTLPNSNDDSESVQPLAAYYSLRLGKLPPTLVCLKSKMQGLAFLPVREIPPQYAESALHRHFIDKHPETDKWTCFVQDENKDDGICGWEQSSMNPGTNGRTTHCRGHTNLYADLIKFRNEQKLYATERKCFLLCLIVIHQSVLV